MQTTPLPLVATSRKKHTDARVVAVLELVLQAKGRTTVCTVLYVHHAAVSSQSKSKVPFRFARLSSNLELFLWRLTFATHCPRLKLPKYCTATPLNKVFFESCLFSSTTFVSRKPSAYQRNAISRPLSQTSDLLLYSSPTRPCSPVRRFTQQEF